MPIAHYMIFSANIPDEGNKVGGQPTLLPVEKPWPDAEDADFGFVLQLRVDGHRLAVPNASYLQIYQDMNEGVDPLPRVLVIPSNAPANASRKVPMHRINEFGIHFDTLEESEFPPMESPLMERAKFFKSKLGGQDPWQNEAGRTFLGQIAESPAGLDFGGTMCSLYLTQEGEVVAELN